MFSLRIKFLVHEIFNLKQFLRCKVEIFDECCISDLNLSRFYHATRLKCLPRILSLYVKIEDSDDKLLENESGSKFKTDIDNF